ncbi:hypothetical protein As57867_006557, partial [Aphanomyces stellatus]
MSCCTTPPTMERSLKRCRDIEGRVFNTLHAAGGHHHILQLLDHHITSDGLDCMTLEYCENGDFLDFVNNARGPLGMFSSLAYFSQLVSAVAFL